ncbi:transporter substrate-binding domain-containing protein (plasmid) [Rhizobium sp. 32-5/1]|uniref:transporter substrate-binding domain-containing protein n=1 Tax=Rhizobium sp. 32-5/1 TaxID=3019602 RepID=UPI00240D7A59|nr:transporter substrate-binding domain-containing protein [Rhizobium sp. 32-5/1]WEZ85485.1 transporter substrate-binding domain-containing protein [Rhizobium sp. 32-5/1]
MKSVVGLAAILAASVALPAHADKLDDIISAGKIRCAVTLDIPPNGFRDDKNEPAGFDVDYCKDLAKALGVEAEIVETQLPDRIPALMSDRADVAVASTSDTLERAKTVGLSIPYFVYKQVVLTRKDSGITDYAGIKGHATGGVAGTFEGIQWENDVKKLNDSSSTYRAFQGQADAVLAVSQGQIDATPLINTMAEEMIKSGKYPNLVIAGDTPYVPDYVTLATLRQEYGLINYLNLFINQQVRTGRYAELYKKWIGSGDPVDLTIKGVYR